MVHRWWNAADFIAMRFIKRPKASDAINISADSEA
jgi:hypothetical protein